MWDTDTGILDMARGLPVLLGRGPAASRRRDHSSLYGLLGEPLALTSYLNYRCHKYLFQFRLAAAWWCPVAGRTRTQAACGVILATALALLFFFCAMVALHRATGDW